MAEETGERTRAEPAGAVSPGHLRRIPPRQRVQAADPVGDAAGPAGGGESCQSKRHGPRAADLGTVEEAVGGGTAGGGRRRGRVEALTMRVEGAATRPGGAQCRSQAATTADGLGHERDEKTAAATTTAQMGLVGDNGWRDSLKIYQLRLVAARFSKESNSDEDDELLSELRDKWDAIENKPSLLLYGGGAALAVWISLVVVRAVDSVPLLPGLLELVGLSYSGWFVYRYLLFQENRKELADKLDDLKKRITGDE